MVELEVDGKRRGNRDAPFFSFLLPLPPSISTHLFFNQLYIKKMKWISGRGRIGRMDRQKCTRFFLPSPSSSFLSPSTPSLLRSSSIVAFIKVSLKVDKDVR